jgi:UDP-N-acetylmuramyl pentapeptide phosphotransferase/UDP-N-acetylglucosamine-1-phosphate transferase
MLNVILTASVSFIITFLAIPAIIKIAEQKKLYDLPDDRKLHTRPIASLGGVGIFGGFFIASILAIPVATNPEFQYFFAAATVIFFLGIKDDMLVLSANKKFLGQVLATAILIHFGDIRITSMHGLLGITEIPLAISYLLSYVSIIVIINAFNLIDGVDGLAGTLGLLTMTVFGAYFFMANMPAYSILAFSLAGSLLAFLLFNYNPAKIFMGDSGSLILGLVNAILVIKFITIADNRSAGYFLESSVAIGFAILMIPLTDTLRVFSMRIFKRRSPFSADREHIHHLLLDRGLNHKYVTLCCLSLNIIFIAVAYFGRVMGVSYTLLTIVGLAFLLLGILLYLNKPPREISVTSLQHNVERLAQKSAAKRVSIKKETAIAEN